MENATAPAAKGPTWVDVEFETGFTRGEDQITSIKLRKPKAGELRGLSLQAVMTADVGAVIDLLPRISDPIMTKEDAASLEADDFAEAADAITGFFLSAAQKKMVASMRSTS